MARIYLENVSENILKEDRSPQSSDVVRCSTDATIADDRPFQLQFELYFAHESDYWKGCVAFVGIERDVRHRTLGRAYLLTLSQLIHVAREENGGSDTKNKQDKIFLNSDH